MYVIKENNRYWNGITWTHDLQQVVVYSSTIAAAKELPNRTCRIIPLTRDESDVYFSQSKGFKNITDK